MNKLFDFILNNTKGWENAELATKQQAYSDVWEEGGVIYEKKKKKEDVSLYSNGATIWKAYKSKEKSKWGCNNETVTHTACTKHPQYNNIKGQGSLLHEGP